MIGTAPLRIFIADDEAPARKKLLRFLAEEQGVIVVGEAANGPATVVGVRDTQPDLLFLDIQMPGMDGFAVLEALADVGKDMTSTVIFVTAHDEYALRALEIHAFDYLLKPFDQTRFAGVMADARRQAQRESHPNWQQLLDAIAAPRSPRLLVEENGRGFLLALNTIDWAEADRNYINLHLGSRTYTVRGTIDSMEKKLDSHQFLRINRSTLVRLDLIRELQKWTHGEYQILLHTGQTLMWTRRYLNRLPDLLKTL